MRGHNISPEAAPAGKRRLGCLTTIGGLAAIALALFFGIGLYFDEGDSARQQERGFVAGMASAFDLATVTAFDGQHLYVTRLQNGTFVALYDKSSKQQELQGDCRVRYDENATLGTATQLPGMSGGFVEDCEGARTVWLVDGDLAFGAGYGDLDRFDTHVDAGGQLVIETDSRSCTRSRGAPGVPPYTVQRCGLGN